MKKSSKVAAAAAAMAMLVCAEAAQAMDVGAMAAVRRNVYGVAPEGSEAVKRKGDTVVFQEKLETLDNSGALVRFVDDSELTLGAKSKVVIDAFVFDPKSVQGNAVIDISVGTLRWITGDMPKGGTVIKTPTATLVLRGTDVIVHVHPDGTTDTTVLDGEVDAYNNVTKQVTTMVPGDGATLGHDGTTSYDGSNNPTSGLDAGNGAGDTAPEHRRGPERPAAPGPVGGGNGGNSGGSSGGGDDGGSGGDDGGNDGGNGCDCH
jgi:hypothetical protein